MWSCRFPDLLALRARKDPPVLRDRPERPDLLERQDPPGRRDQPDLLAAVTHRVAMPEEADNSRKPDLSFRLSDKGENNGNCCLHSGWTDRGDSGQNSDAWDTR